MKEPRQNPEKLLQQVQAEEQQAKRGKLKIYLGAAPGVGKTYTMLQDALAQRAQGLDVVIGIVESHGRAEIEALLTGLEILPRQTVNYRDKSLLEFDLEAALKRNPGLILIDEMAHTNVSGLRHAKRWQDIKEILDRGIDVATTLNVQHIDSLNDDVKQILGIHITETVPDSMLELADTIELIDLPPEDLLKRLHNGKVYFPQQAKLAAENFFRKGNLIALRELALRFTAERVGAQVLLYRHGQGIQPIWPTKEKILVCIGSDTAALKLIRTAKRMAASMHTEWIAVYIDTPRQNRSETNHNQAILNLRLAEQLGAQTRILTGIDLVKEIMDFAHDQNVTQIIIGKRIRSRWISLWRKDLADEIVRHSGIIDIYVVTFEIENKKILKTNSTKSIIPWRIYGVTIGMVVIATLINFLLQPWLSTSNLIMVYLLGVTLVALFGRTGPAVLVSILSVLAYDFFFIPPFFSFAVTDIQYFFTLVVMLIVTQVISHLTIITRRQAASARFIEHQTAALHSLSRQLASTRGTDKLAEISTRYIADVFNCKVTIFLPENNHLVIRSQYGIHEELNTKEFSIAQWVYELGQMAGLGTDTLSFSNALYVPLLASQGTIGVLRIQPLQIKQLFTPEQLRLLESCAHQIALALEVDRLQEKTMTLETDQARQALLHAVKHDLHTPIIAAMGSASTLVELNQELQSHEIANIGNAIYVELEQLNRLINNLLQITYLESGDVKLQKAPASIEESIKVALDAENKKLNNRSVNLHVDKTITKILFDKTLIEDVLINLIDNAVKFTPPASPIELSVIQEQDHIVVSIADQGPGIVHDEVNKLFEKFYRGRMLTTERGLGLGLAICHHIITAHGGKIWAENRKEGGAVFRFNLPIGQ